VARAEQAGLPVLFHVGNPGELPNGTQKNNGAPRIPNFHGGSENFPSLSPLVRDYDGAQIGIYCDNRDLQWDRRQVVENIDFVLGTVVANHDS